MKTEVFSPTSLSVEVPKTPSAAGNPSGQKPNSGGPFLHELLVLNPTCEKTTPEATQPLFIFDTHLQAEAAIHSLNKAGFDVTKLSLIGKGYHSEEHALGFYTSGDRVKSWGSAGAFWGGIWGMLLAPAVFFLPGLGLVALAGPMVAALVGALEGAVVVGGLSALGAALTQIGVPEDQVIKFETALKVDKYVLMVHGTAADVAQAGEMLVNAQTLVAE